MLRVKGLVALERRVREQLRSGMLPDELARAERAVTGAVAHIDAALARHRLPPGALSAPTRKAYGFLKALDFANLPLPQAAPVRKLSGISNVTATAQWAAAALAELGAAPGPGQERQAAIVARIGRAVNAVERICADHAAPPSVLRAPTRRAYGWLRFLTGPANLERHLDAIRRALAIAEGLTVQPTSPVVVEFSPTAALWRRTQRGGVTRVQMAEGLIAASDGVLEAVLRAALTREAARDRRVYLGFTETEAYREVLLELDLAAEVDADQPQGGAHDLRELFASVNAAYFGGALSTPRLTWSSRLTSRRLGYFEPQRDRVVVSRTLDAEGVPPLVVEYVLYHELLHRELGAKWSGTRLRSHTAEFRREERKFARRQEAEEWMRGRQRARER